jgi:DNA ligase-associated metallophosphoesterase
MNLRAQSRFSATSEAAVRGERVVCDARGVAWFPEMRLLAVSDLHLEKGSRQARRGYMLPPYDTAATLARLGAVIADYDPAMVVSLGDSFDDIGGAARMPAIYRDQLLALMKGRDWFWVAGNHDPEKPADLPGATVQELGIGGIVFRHEPSAGRLAGEIAGHLHPGARIVQRGRSVRRRCFAADGNRLIMPAFGTFTGALNVLDRAFANLFCPDNFVAYMLGTDRVYPMDRRLLRAD